MFEPWALPGSVLLRYPTGDRRTRLGRLASTWTIIGQRAAANWRLLGVLGLGIVVAATLLSAAPIYARTMADLGVTFSIRDELQDSPATRAFINDVPLGTDTGKETIDAVQQRIDDRVGWFMGSQVVDRRTAAFTIQDNPAGTLPPRVEFQALDGYGEHVSVVEGRLPAPGALDGPVEIALSQTAADAAHLSAGDTISLGELLNDCEQQIIEGDMPTITPCPPNVPTVQLTFALQATITGIVAPRDAEDPFWGGDVEAFFNPRRDLPGAGPTLPAFVNEGTLSSGIASALPGYRADYTWLLFVQPDVLTRANFTRARDDLQALSQELRQVNGFAVSPLVGVLDRFERSSSVRQTPLTILLLQISAIALFYVGLIAAIVVERQSDEIALLRSRGASVGQVLTVYLLEAAIIGVPTLLVAPILATAATAALGLTPTFADVNDGKLLPAVLAPEAFLWAGAGVFLGLLAIAVPVFVVARRTAVTQRRHEARPSPSILHRYYLDIALAAFAALMLWELNERGSAFEPSPTGGVSSDPILLASPALIIAAAAALVLRFYPMLLRLAARLLALAAGITVVIGLWQLVRRPGQYTRLTLLLMMGVAVGTFAASYSSTAERSLKDRASFAAGTDLRATNLSRLELHGTIADTEAALREVDGVSAASLVFRNQSRTGTVGRAGRQINVLAVDPAAVGPLLFTRDDFADESLRSLLFRLTGPSQLQGMPLPEGTTALSLWVNMTQPRPETTLWARVRGANGNHGLLQFGKLDTSGWREMRAEVDSSVAQPATVVGLVMTEPPNRFNVSNAPLLVDDFAAIHPGGSTLLDDFEGPVRWQPLPTPDAATDTFETTTENAHGGQSAGSFTFRLGVQAERRALYVADPIIPIAALASDDFIASNGIPVGGTGLVREGQALVPIRIVASYHLFPTLPTRQGPSLVVNLSQYASFVNAFSPSGVVGVSPNEAWFSLAPNADPEAVKAALGERPLNLTRFVDRRAELERIKQNPLLIAGGAGILVVSFVGVLLLIGAAFLVSLWTAVQRRRTEFAVLRAMGLSRLQLLRVLALEYALVSFVGVIVGAYLGLVVGRRMLSFLNVTETGDKVEPRFILQTDWSMVAGGGAVVFGIFLVALLVAVRVLARTNDAQALRNE